MRLTRSKTEIRLGRHGYQQLGCGCYSSVYHRPGSDRVMKVGSCTTWEPYVRWATQHGYAGNFSPKVHSFKWMPGGWYIASVERLTVTVDASNEDYDFKRAISDMWGCGCDVSDMLEDRYPGLKLFVRDVRAAGFSGDWHIANWMLHNDRLVLIDPQGEHARNTSTCWRPRGCEVVERMAA